MSRIPRSQSGVSLIGAIIAIGILGIISVSLSKMLQTTFKANKEARIRDDRLGITNLLRQRLRCRETLQSATCNSNQFFALRDRDGKTIGSPEFQAWRLGELHIRASCNNTALKIETARLKGVEQFRRNPLTKQDDEWRPLTTTGEFECREYFKDINNVGCNGQSFCNENVGNYVLVTADLVAQTSAVGCNLLDLPGWHYTGTATCPEGLSGCGWWRALSDPSLWRWYS